jgi:DNA polymerase-3 subunit gamma/tau
LRIADWVRKPLFQSAIQNPPSAIDMTHTALARKYRPKRFSELLAQDHVAAGLAGAVARNRVAHAYLLTGPRGVGKTTAARILAMALNCERRPNAEVGTRNAERTGSGPVPTSGEPCGECESCRRIWSGAANLDVVEIDAASNRGVDDARELRERAMYAASGPERSKVYIIDEAHMLTREAWNALLKILEEPPPRVVFVFATTEPHKIANTAAPVLSRMQRFDFRRIGPATIAERLREVAGLEGLRIEEDALALIARVALGGMRDALSMVDQAVAFGEGPVTAARVRDALGLIGDELYAELLDILAERRSADVLPFVARLVEAGADLAEFTGGLGEVLRAVLQQILGGEPEGLTEVLRSGVARRAPGYRAGDLLRMLKLLAEAEESIRRSPNARLHVETLLLELTLLDRTVELSEVLQALGVGARGGAGGTGGTERAGIMGSSPRPASTTTARTSATPMPSAPPMPPVPPAPPPAPAASSEPEVIRRWQEVIDAVGQKSRMLREALAHATPAVEGEALALDVSGSDVHLQGLENGRKAIEAAVRGVIGAALNVVVRPAGPAAPGGGGEPRRLNRDLEREERLQRYRSKDAALDAAAEALDLELLD